MKKLFCILITGMIFLLSACSPTIPEEDMSESLNSTSEQTVLTHEHKIDGIRINTEYSTGKYDIKNWRVTDNKIIDIKLNVENLPEGYEVFVEHVHADINIKSTEADVNGIKQDTMDDYFHSNLQPGFCVSEGHDYNEVFAIEGYNKDFLTGWCMQYYGTVSEHKVTEYDIRASAYAQKLNVVYDLAIKAPNDKYYYTDTISDEIMINLKQEETK